MMFAIFATWIVVAVVSAVATSALMKYGGHGRMSDILLGVAGSGVAWGIVWGLGMFREPGIVATAVLALAGAGAIITVQRKYFYVPVGKPRTPPRLR